MDKPEVELTLGKFRFVNGTTKKYKARMAMVPTQPHQTPQNTKPFGGNNTIMQPADTADADEGGGVPANMTVYIYFQDQDTMTWYVGTHANGNDAISGAFVIFGGGNNLKGEIMLGVEGGGTMISTMGWSEGAPPDA